MSTSISVKKIPDVLSLQTSEPGDEVAAKPLYHLLATPCPDQQARRLGADYLHQQLNKSSALPCDLPASPAELQSWIAGRVEQIGVQYADYLSRRKAGEPRRYFSNKSHALYFLRAVAPTKLVDGSWLYGILQHWNDIRFRPLVLTYLEELGDGDAAMNHVTLYRQLLATHDCEDWDSLAEDHFVQGAIQLALAYQAEEYLPEVIGYNLGYEQLPLHLLITAYELNELGIDPYYFTLHVTIDNASTGHASKAAQVVAELVQQQDDPENFYRRIQNGYRLNDLGVSTLAVINDFDLEQELVAILQAKAVVGQNMHSDYCRFGGKTVNEWLQEPASIALFLAELQQAGWIKRGEDPAESRFWRMICTAGAEMFGVFSAYETQVLSDWIKGPLADTTQRRRPSFRALQRVRAQKRDERKKASPRMQLVVSDHTSPLAPEKNIIVLSPDPTGPDMTEMIASLSPGLHHTPEGLQATRLFSAAVRSDITS